MPQPKVSIVRPRRRRRTRDPNCIYAEVHVCLFMYAYAERNIV